MWAIFKTLFYSLSTNLNKKMLGKTSFLHFLSYKYFLGAVFLAIYFIFSNAYINDGGFYLLLIISIILMATHFLSDFGLSKVKATTHTILGQNRLVIIFIASLLLGPVFSEKTISIYNYFGILFIVIASLLACKEEFKTSLNKKNVLIGITVSLAVTVGVILNAYLLSYSFTHNLFSIDAYIIFSIFFIFAIFSLLQLFSKNKFEEQKFSFKEIVIMQAVGLLTIGVNISKAFSIEQIGVYKTELLLSLSPFFVFILAIAVKDEKLNFKVVSSTLISILGAILLFV